MKHKRMKALAVLFVIMQAFFSTSCNKDDDGNVADEPLPYMVVGNKWRYDMVYFSGIHDTATYEIVDETENIFKLITYNSTDTLTKFWFVKNGFLKSYNEGQSMEDAELVVMANPTVGDKLYYSFNKDRWSLEPIAEDTFGTLEVVRTDETRIIPPHLFSDVFTIELSNNINAIKSERQYSESYGFLSRTEYPPVTLIDVNF